MKFKLVPVEPTETMMLNGSGCKRHAFDDMGCVNRELRRGIWDNMLAAAPAPAFDEAAERAAHKAWYLEHCGVGGAAALIASWQAWSACAKAKAGVLKIEGERPFWTYAGFVVVLDRTMHPDVMRVGNRVFEVLKGGES
jgi:hypothetical protein